MKIIAIIALASLLILSACVNPHDYEKYKEDIYGEDLVLEPDRCIMSSGKISCVDAKVTPNEVTLMFRNEVGNMIDIVTVSIGEVCSANQVGKVVNRDYVTVVASGCEFTSDEQISEEIEIYYVDTVSGLRHNAIGELVRVVE